MTAGKTTNFKESLHKAYFNKNCILNIYRYYMKGTSKKKVVFLFLLMCVTLALIPRAKAADTLAKPIVTLPTGWQIEKDIAYPGAQGEFDPVGAGLLKYISADQNNIMWVYYEKNYANFFSDDSLKNDAVKIYNRDDLSSAQLNESGVQVYAGVMSGYTIGFNTTSKIIIMEIVFVKENYYFNVKVVSDIVKSTNQDFDEIDSVINSISIPQPPEPYYYIVTAIIIVVVVALTLIILLRRRRKTQVPGISITNDSSKNKNSIKPNNDSPIKENIGIAFCLNCGKENTTGAQYCITCGNPLNSIIGLNTKNNTLPQGNSKYCRYCGAINSTTAIHCQNCGKRIA
jgi:hypothetical protein